MCDRYMLILRYNVRLNLFHAYILGNNVENSKCFLHFGLSYKQGKYTNFPYVDFCRFFTSDGIGIKLSKNNNIISVAISLMLSPFCPLNDWTINPVI